VLVYAIVRVWRAHERGKLLERVRDTRVTGQTWHLWRERILARRRQEELALAFAARPRSALTATALQVWKRVHRTRQNALQLATQYHAVQMQQRAVLSWRIKLRQHHKLAKQARIAERYLVTRAAWGKWRQLVAERSRQRKMQVFERDKARKAFESKSSLVIFRGLALTPQQDGLTVLRRSVV
jgi:protein SFI1